MKKLIVFLILVLIGLELSGQTGPVFQYTNPSKETLRSLAKEESAKGYAYRNYLINVINIGLEDTTFRISDSNVDFIFDHLFLEEVFLPQYYLNSGYDPSLEKMVPSKGNKFGDSFQWVFRIGTFALPVIKPNCGNIIVVKVIRKQQDPIQEESVILKKDNNWEYIAPKKEVENLNFDFVPIKKEKKKIKKWVKVFIVVVASIVTGVTVGFLLKNKNKSSGDPGGAPITPDVEVDEGGPGGAPPSN